MENPTVYIHDNDKESRQRLIAQMATDIMAKSLRVKETVEEIIACSIITTLGHAMQNGQTADAMIEEVEDFLSAYMLARLRTYGLQSRN